MLAGRVGDGTGRPFLEPGPAATIRLLEARRRPVYRSVADATIDVSWVPAQVVVERAERLVAAWLAGAPRERS